jgi:glycosyltransferase involved in cell wall biosynthesis
LDEPTNGLDPRAAREVQELLRRSATQGKTIFLSTHLLDMAERLCSRLGIIHKGELVAVGALDQLRREVHPLRDYRSYFALKRALREFAPEVVHTHSAKGGMFGRMAATALKTPAVVHTVHGAPFHAYQSRLAQSAIRYCERYAAGKCHRLVSVADAMTEQLVQARVAPREKFVTVYSGMDVEPFLNANQHRTSVRRSLGYGDEHVVIGKIPRLFRLKGHEDVIAAARQVIPHCPHARFLFVGDGILRQQCQAQIAAAGMTNHFQFTGLVPPHQIPALIGAMDVVVHASLREGLARALPQALIAGKPVSSYDVDGSREVVLDDVTGYLLPPRDVPGLGRALVRLASDAELRGRLGAEGRRRFTDQFRHETMTAKLRDLYLDLLR